MLSVSSAGFDRKMLTSEYRSAFMKEWGRVKGEMLRVRGVMVAVGGVCC